MSSLTAPSKKPALLPYHSRKFHIQRIMDESLEDEGVWSAFMSANDPPRLLPLATLLAATRSPIYRRISRFSSAIPRALGFPNRFTRLLRNGQMEFSAYNAGLNIPTGITPPSPLSVTLEAAPQSQQGNVVCDVIPTELSVPGPSVWQSLRRALAGVAVLPLLTMSLLARIVGYLLGMISQLFGSG
ncbi:hypothetical protein BKA70DRAFT_1228189 [Coprinopsis sp. MPI-PUGE-AT-0042]|nr:hypothetical protein BKA70DRAFT_1228189 [Coprinopsis sp. MPI-PUGE-AT-0042]